jgi:hypothetical protein
VLDSAPAGPPMDEASRRYAQINLPHARTVAGRVERTLEALGAFGANGSSAASRLKHAMAALERVLEPFDEDPGVAEAIAAADEAAERARELVESIVTAQVSSDRLGQHVRNLFECLALAEEGALLSLRCGERPDSPLR